MTPTPSLSSRSHFRPQPQTHTTLKAPSSPLAQSHSQTRSRRCSLASSRSQMRIQMRTQSTRSPLARLRSPTLAGFSSCPARSRTAQLCLTPTVSARTHSVPDEPPRCIRSARGPRRTRSRSKSQSQQRWPSLGRSSSRHLPTPTLWLFQLELLM